MTFYDEARLPDGSPRPDGGAGLAALDGTDLVAASATLRRALEGRGVGFRSVGGEAGFGVDPVPRVLGADEWAVLEDGLAQRVRALDAFVADAYGPQRAVAEGVVPARVVESAEGWSREWRACARPATCGSASPAWTWSATRTASSSCSRTT